MWLKKVEQADATCLPCRVKVKWQLGTFDFRDDTSIPVQKTMILQLGKTFEVAVKVLSYGYDFVVISIVVYLGNPNHGLYFLTEEALLM